MPRMTVAQTGSANMSAFLDTIAFSEIGAEILAGSDNGYDVLVGSTPKMILTFDNYAVHPDVLSASMNSTAAGRYQFLYRYWPAYKVSLSLDDFGPVSQDTWAIQLIHECRAQDSIACGDIARAIEQCSSRWASFPGPTTYGQHQNTANALTAAFSAAGGSLS